MKRFVLAATLVAAGAFGAIAQKVTIEAHDLPASDVFRDIMQQTGKNFIYSTDLLQDYRVSVTAKDKPLRKVLQSMFAGSDIEFKIKGKDVMLRRRRRKVESVTLSNRVDTMVNYVAAPTQLEELVVVSRLEAPDVSTAEIGAEKITAKEISSVPVLLGEADVLKALHMQPGVQESAEGMAGMHVHGGGADENMCMLDNIPLYQVNHFAGLFSAFNVDAIRYIDFFKSSIPAKYDGRLSSFLDVRTKNGNPDGHHGSIKLGLTSGAFNINGPIGKATTYSVAMRRSWYDVLTIPFLALINSAQDEKITFAYSFMDLNAKVNHRFSSSSSAYVSVYFGDDYLRSGSKDTFDGDAYYFGSDDQYKFHWGNLVTQAGVIHNFSSTLNGEFTAAFTKYFSKMKKDEYSSEKYNGNLITSTRAKASTSNDIDDLIAKADFYWNPSENTHVKFGAAYTLHNFLPANTVTESTVDNVHTEVRDSSRTYKASELNAYIEDDWRISKKIRANIGVHASLFHIDGKSHFGISPRASISFRPSKDWAFKAAYSTTTQYVHQLVRSYLALPTDKWIPVSGNLKPQRAYKVAVGAYWSIAGGNYTLSAEAYHKQMRNLIDYCDEYYLNPPMEFWNARLTTGKGTSKGLDLKFEKVFGKFTGHIAYSLAWADRFFPEKNNGRPFPARFDNRHSINVLMNWKINSKVEINAAWTGHSGNRITLLSQNWSTPDFGPDFNYSEATLKAPINNFRLPFYHRLDLGLLVRNRRGFWNFGLYNAYCQKNAVFVTHGTKREIVNTPGGVAINYKPVFKKVSLLPIIPSISYTWQF